MMNIKVSLSLRSRGIQNLNFTSNIVVITHPIRFENIQIGIWIPEIGENNEF